MSLAAAPASVDLRFRRVALALLLAAIAYKSGGLFLGILKSQPLGTDFSCFWAGAKVALSEPARVYDFTYVSQVQGWPMGAQLRPFIYPPSALLLFLPFAALPMNAAYFLAMAVTGALFLWAAMRAGAPWWTALFPVVTLIFACGQITFAMGALVLFGLACRDRPLLAGVLFGAAAALKPQMMLLIPLGLLADRNWRALAAAAVTGLALCAASALVWGPQIWLDWLAAVPRFQREVIPSIPLLKVDEVTPYAALELIGAPGALAYLFAPAVAWLVWTTFRATDEPLPRAAAAMGGALMLSPYAMNYDAGLLAPGVAALLARREERTWPLYAVLASLFAITTLAGMGPLLTGLGPAVVAAARRRYSAA